MYKNSIEYLKDLLLLLDLKIYKYISEENLEDKKELNPFNGLAITEAEVITILEDKLKQRNNLEVDKIDKKINKLSFEINTKLNENLTQGIELNFERVCSVFNLDYTERNVLLIGISVELDIKYEKIYGYVNDNINKKRASIDLSLKLLELSFEERIAFRNRLFGENLFKLFVLKDNSACNDDLFFQNEIVINNRILDFILENPGLDSKLNSFISIYKTNLIVKEVEYKKEILDKLTFAIDNFTYKAENNLFVNLFGDKGIGKKQLVRSYANKVHRELMCVNTNSLFIETDNIIKNLFNIKREAVLRNSIICLENFKQDANGLDKANIFLKEIFRIIGYFNEIIFIVSETKCNIKDYINDNFSISYEVPRANYEERLKLWSFYFEKYKIQNIDFQDLALKFNFTPLQISNASKRMKAMSLLENNGENLIYESCYEQIENKLEEKAVKVKVEYSWDQLVLQEEQKKLLRDACNQVKNKHIVYEEWGFGSKLSYGKGVSVICTGPPGTGKTMSAQVMARELNLQLYKIDLSQMVSKYIGETEKNLHDIFKEASLSNSILFFDEADSLFGKRSEVTSSNDRYANLETSYLLQKIEEYEGIVMMATNLINNIDKAFLRRINYIISYPFPNEEARKKIWQFMLSENSLQDENINLEYLAKNFEIAGGNIKNIVVYAAFLAAEKREKISMRHLLVAIKYELQKMDKLLLIKDFGEYKHLLVKESFKISNY